jgi:hypothetical protein
MATGNIDSINDIQAPATLPDAQNPLPIHPATGVMLAGWLAERADGLAFDELYAVVDGRPIRVPVEQRIDVGTFYKNPNLDRSGFRVQIAAKEFKAGLTRVDLVGVLNKDHSLYRFPNPLYFRVR